MQDQVMILEQQVEGSKAILAQGREACSQASRSFTRQS
jgi:hypothetical protein